MAGGAVECGAECGAGGVWRGGCDGGPAARRGAVPPGKVNSTTAAEGVDGRGGRGCVQLQGRITSLRELCGNSEQHRRERWRWER